MRALALSPQVRGFHHIEFYCGDASQAWRRFAGALGMQLVAKSDLSTGNRVCARCAASAVSIVIAISALSLSRARARARRGLTARPADDRRSYVVRSHDLTFVFTAPYLRADELARDGGDAASDDAAARAL